MTEHKPEDFDPEDECEWCSDLLKDAIEEIQEAPNGSGELFCSTSCMEIWLENQGLDENGEPLED